MRLGLSGFGFLLFVLVGAVGCGGSQTVPVTGVVTMDGQPADQCEVLFTPKEGRPASAITDSQGKFTLSTFESGDGAVPGTHQVTICEHYPPGKAPPMGAMLPSRFPSQYADPTTTPFTANVERGGKNEFTFEMKKGAEKSAEKGS